MVIVFPGDQVRRARR
uniref:Uncharacterized protein n=1 Tax=Arundo donax TaxID=35708 RepID=A0A0A8Z015_ARUDO